MECSARADGIGAVVSSQKLSPPTSRRLVNPIEVLRALVAKELKVKYKRSVLGFAWSLVTPLALSAIYLFVFVHVYQVPRKDFVLFLLVGLLPWNYFNLSILSATTSLVDNGSLIRKVYFPRFLLPSSNVLANLINFLAGMGILIVLLIFAGRPVWISLHWLVAAVVVETILCLGVALLLSITNVHFRDIGQLISILVLVLFFATPIVYDLSDIDREMFRTILLANPLTGIMQTYRSSLYEPSVPNLSYFGLAVAESLLIFGLGALVFRRFSREVAKEV